MNLTLQTVSQARARLDKAAGTLDVSEGVLDDIYARMAPDSC